MAFSNRPSEIWGSLLAGLSRGASQLDAAGQSQVNDLSKRTESLIASRDRLRPAEFESAMESIHKKAVQYQWDYHVKPYGSNPGDIIEDNGIRKLRTEDGHLTPIAYTPQFMKENAVPIGETGQIAIPISPNEPYKIVAAKQRDLAGESQLIDSAEKGINDIYDKMVAQLNQDPSRMVDLDGKKVPIPLSSKEKRELSIAAADGYLSRKLQAKNVAKQLADAGAETMMRGIGGDVPDPFKAEERRRQELQDRVLGGAAQRDAARELKRSIGGTDAMPGSAGGDVITGQPTTAPTTPAATDNDTATLAAIASAMGSDATNDPIAKATVPTLGSFQDKLVAAGMMSRPLTAMSKDDMNARYRAVADGVVVQLPDGRRYIKDEGKFWQAPWSREQLQSNVMLDAAGDPIIDPSTGEAAKGIIAQLEEGKSAVVRQQEESEGVTPPPIPADQPGEIINPFVQQPSQAVATPPPEPRNIPAATVPKRAATPDVKTPADVVPKEAEIPTSIQPPDYSADQAFNTLKTIYNQPKLRQQFRSAQVMPANADISQLPPGVPFRHPKTGHYIIIQNDGTAIVVKKQDVDRYEKRFGRQQQQLANPDQTITFPMG